MNPNKDIDTIVLGGGFYGCCIALLLSKYFSHVLLIEKEEDILQRASAKNQARVHSGYHYPRSFMTAIRSSINFPRFVSNFRTAIMDDVKKIYVVAKYGSKTNSKQFYNLFKKLGVRIDRVSPDFLKKFFNLYLIEDAFQVNEFVFDCSILKNILREKLEANGVKILFGVEIKRVVQWDNKLIVHASTGKEYITEHVFSCLYSRLNVLLTGSGQPLLPLKNEITEMALVSPPEPLSKLAITMIDGPFFSLMPYPSRKLYTLSHVRYTPHITWADQEKLQDGYALLREKQLRSNFLYMQHDVSRYMPVLAELQYVDSLFEVKTVLERNEIDDGRPILFREGPGLKNFFTVLGGKIDNIYDVLHVITETMIPSGFRKNIMYKLFD